MPIEPMRNASLRRLSISVLAGLVIIVGSPSAVNAEGKPENPCAAETLAAAREAEAATTAERPVDIGSVDSALTVQPPINVFVRPSLFSDDFEASGDISRWRRTDTLQSEEELVNRGEFAVRGQGTIDGGGTFARRKLDTNVNEVYYRVLFNIISQGQNSVDLIAIRSPNDRNLLTVFVDDRGFIGLVDDVMEETIVGSTHVPRQSWTDLQLHAQYDAETGTVETGVWINGKEVPELTRFASINDQVDAQDLRQTIALDGGVVGRIELGDSEGGRVYDIVFDDVIVSQYWINRAQAPEPVSGTLVVQTVPAVEGMPFVLDNEVFYTDAGGRVTISVARWSNDLRTRIVSPVSELPSGTYSRLSRWYGWSDIHDEFVYASVSLTYPITWRFVNEAGIELPARTVSSLTFKSSLGVRYTYTIDQHGQVQLFQGSRVVPSHSGMENKDIYYTLDYACVAGTNVVNRAQQKYFPNQTQDWTIELLFYSADISAHDAFFGFGLGSSIDLTYPDGSVSVIPLDDDGKVFLEALPRGDYEMSVNGPGYSPPRPVAVTRNQVVELETVSYVDMASAALFLAAAGFGLLFAGRPELYRRPLRTVRRLVVPAPRQGAEGAGT